MVHQTELDLVLRKSARGGELEPPGTPGPGAERRRQLGRVSDAWRPRRL